MANGNTPAGLDQAVQPQPCADASAGKSCGAEPLLEGAGISHPQRVLRDAESGAVPRCLAELSTHGGRGALWVPGAGARSGGGGGLGSLSRLCRDKIGAYIVGMGSSQACERTPAAMDGVGTGRRTPGDPRDNVGGHVALHVPWGKQKSIAIAAAEQTQADGCSGA